MSFLNINKNDLWNLCENEVCEEKLERLIFSNNLFFKPKETKYGVTKDVLYRFFKSKEDNEYVFIDDNNEESIAWIGIDGEFIIDEKYVSKEINDLIDLKNYIK